MKRVSLLPGEYLTIEGAARLNIKEGEVLIGEKEYFEGEEYIILRGDKIFVKAMKESTLEIFLGTGGSIKKVEQVIPESWVKAAKAILDHEKPCVSMIVGGVDTGKTTLTTYIANQCFENNLRTIVIDADLGQSSIGPPTTISLGIVNRKISRLSDLNMESGFFVGSTSPNHHLLQCISGLRLLLDKALQLKGDVILIDTSGMISGGPGRALKIHKTMLIKPNFLFILRKGKELDYLINIFRNINVRPLEVPEEVRGTSREERRFFRELAFRNYFSNAREIEFDLKKVKVIGTFFGTGTVDEEMKYKISSFFKEKINYCENLGEGYLIVTEKPRQGRVRNDFDRQFKVLEKGFEEQILVGLLDGDQELLDLGIMRRIDYSNKKAYVYSPTIDPDKINTIKLGSIRIKEDGKEIGFIPLGSF
ncbi:MAG: Clp1/GlmU family protein [Candidatus Hydrothermarchaeota archaeon]